MNFTEAFKEVHERTREVSRTIARAVKSADANLDYMWEKAKSWLWPEPEPIPPPAPPEPAPEPLGVNTEGELLDLHNAQRSTPLTIDVRLARAAQEHAERMARQGSMTHASLSQRVDASGYLARSLGENVAMGYGSPARAVAGWMKSKGHRRNITNAVYLDVGFGVADDKQGRRWWCCILASSGEQNEIGGDNYTDQNISDPPGINAQPLDVEWAEGQWGQRE